MPPFGPVAIPDVGRSKNNGRESRSIRVTSDQLPNSSARFPRPTANVAGNVETSQIPDRSRCWCAERHRPFPRGRTSLVGTYQMPVVPDTVGGRGPHRSSLAGRRLRRRAGVSRHTDVETARAALIQAAEQSLHVRIQSLHCAHADERMHGLATYAPPVGHSSHGRTRSGPSQRKQRGFRLKSARISLGNGLGGTR